MSLGALVDLVRDEGPDVIRALVAMIKRIRARRGLNKAAVIADFEAVAADAVDAKRRASQRLHDRFAAEQVARVTLDPGSNGDGHE